MGLLRNGHSRENGNLFLKKQPRLL